MIKSLLGKKASKQIESSKLGRTKLGRAAAGYLDEEKREAEAYESFSMVTEAMGLRYFRRRILIIALIVNLVSWVSLFLLPGTVRWLVLGAGLIFSKGGLLLVLPACSATLIGAYAAFRSWFPELESNISSDVMSSFDRQNESLRTWRIWVVSCGLAGVNGILLVIGYMYMSGEWQTFAR